MHSDIFFLLATFHRYPWASVSFAASVNQNALAAGVVDDSPETAAEEAPPPVAEEALLLLPGNTAAGGTALDAEG